MNRSRALILLSVMNLALTGCATRKFKPAPISPAETAFRLEARNLRDPGLRQFLEKNLGHQLSPWPVESWDLSTLTLAALYFSPEMEIARARTEAAEATVVTAGARTNPSLSVHPGVPSPYLFGLDLDFPIETAGKRRYRIERTRELTAGARFGLTNTAWKVRSQVRRAFLGHIVAARDLDLLRAEERLELSRVSLLRSGSPLARSHGRKSIPLASICRTPGWLFGSPRAASP